MLRAVVIAVSIVIAIWVLNIAAGFLTANYASSRYKSAAIATEGFARASEIRSRVDQFFQMNGYFPDSNRELGIGEPETYQNSTVSTAVIGPLGTIRVNFSDDALKDAAIVMRPVANITGTGPSLRWDCFAINIDEATASLIHEPRCTIVKDLDAIPALPKPEVTVDNLINAIHARRASLVRHLIVAGVNVNGLSQTRESPLFAAISAGDSLSLELLIEAGADVNLRLPQTGATPLMTVTRSGCNSNAVRLLIEAGAEIEGRDEKGMTPLMHAARSGEVNCVNALLRAGADVAATDYAGNKAVNYAASYGQSSSVYSALYKHELKQKQGGDFFYRLPPVE